MSNFRYLPYQPQLEPVAWGSNIWTVEGPEVCYKLGGIPLPCPTRMTVVRLAHGKLWLHSPVAFSTTLATALKQLGEIEALVAPNSYHHLHVQTWAQSVPAASVYASSDLLERRGCSHWKALTTSAPASWDGALSHLLVEFGRF